MTLSSDITRANIVLTGLPDTKCFTSWQDFLQELPNFLGVEISASSITNVIVSNVQPTSSQTNSIWFRTSNDGSFIGIYVFSQGAWQNIYPINVDSPVTTNQIFWFFGDSTQPPAGFTNTNDYTGLSAAVQAALAAMWVNETGVFTYYSAVFTGF